MLIHWHTVLGESWTCFTANTSKYDRSKGTRFAPSSELEVRFELQANANAHVGLFTSFHDLSTMYEIVIGGWNNTQSAIRDQVKAACFVVFLALGLMVHCRQRCG